MYQIPKITDKTVVKMNNKKTNFLYHRLLAIAFSMVTVLDDFKGKNTKEDDYINESAIPFLENLFKQIIKEDLDTTSNSQYVMNVGNRIYDLLPENNLIQLEIICKLQLKAIEETKMSTPHLNDFKTLCDNLVSFTNNVITNVSAYENKVNTIIRKNITV